VRWQAQRDTALDPVFFFIQHQIFSAKILSGLATSRRHDVALGPVFFFQHQFSCQKAKAVSRCACHRTPRSRPELLSHSYPVTQLVKITRRDLLVRAHATLHFNQIALSLSELDQTLLCASVLHNKQTTYASVGLYRTRGNQHRWF
jgi:hypothetical protein